ncbi:hypothetical protein BH24GEM1_BH24GEM1_12400 [soil metagenome]
MLAVKLDLLQTLSLAAVLFLLGLELRKRIGWLDRLNIPAAVVGGLMFALLVLAGRDRFLSVQLDTTAQPVLSVAFFSTIGMGASLALLRAGGMQVVIFLLFATLFCFVQNFLGIAIADGFGQNPLLGVMAGSVTPVWAGTAGLSGGSAGRRLLRRFHQRHHHHVLRALDTLITSGATHDYDLSPRPPGASGTTRQGMRGVPRDRRPLGPPAPLPQLRPRGLLRQLLGQARHAALPCLPAPRRPVVRARRGLGLVLYRLRDAGALPFRALTERARLRVAP